MGLWMDGFGYAVVGGIGMIFPLVHLYSIFGNWPRVFRLRLVCRICLRAAGQYQQDEKEEQNGSFHTDLRAHGVFLSPL